MVETSRDWSEKLPFALWAYRTSFCTTTGATPYSLVYGMEDVLPIEIEMGSLRVVLEQQISETKWAQARFDQLNLLDERRLRAADHVQAYQRKMARAFKKRVKLDHCKKGDLVLRILKGTPPSENTWHASGRDTWHVSYSDTWHALSSGSPSSGLPIKHTCAPFISGLPQGRANDAYKA
ncbi:hypothetical protein CK203_036815 [Vitis vinifera]|uniref:Uncharacterized protein n=1 Tax=Vitis vinifera TaxID=29760 RepID=A0A438DIB2_VITVI|nr:hypothetical protein CK203_100015 [Vitis vinifera]RVW90331.1 hypothetical protein CK203_036815 [Vitis vinifera]